MATVDPRIADIVAHLPGVKVAVRAERDKVARIAEALFASHDNPGGHHITTENHSTDALVFFEGPAALSVEFGHWAGQGNDRVHVAGLHILGRAAAAAAL